MISILESHLNNGLILLLVVLCSIISTSVSGQPIPGDVFRDYVWKTPENSGYDFLRVIGDGDYREPVGYTDAFPEECIENGWILFNQDVDLDLASKAELQVEFLLSHDQTSGFAVKVNDGNWHPFEMPEAIPEPRINYLQHNYPIVDIPLEEIHQGTINHIRFRVDSVQRFGMPQNILYGFRLRIYYDEAKEHPEAHISGLEDGQGIGEHQTLQLTQMKGDIREVQYVALCRDVNMEGDGICRQWHYTYYRGEFRNNIGSVREKPFTCIWNTSWLPDQYQEMEISAFVSDKEGLTHFLPSIKRLSLDRDYSVELSTPYYIPENWATREQEYTEKILISGNPEDAQAFQLVFTSWSPGYLNGILINNWLVPTFKDCNYCYASHRITLQEPYFLKQGINQITTLLTPPVNGKMVHGTEIMFPGMMLLVRYDKPGVTISECKWKGEDHFKVDTEHATWYIEKKSGGCSSLVDNEGRDWIDFRKTGDNPPLLSSDSDYRGVPNLVFQGNDNGVGHPGFDACTSTKDSNNEILVVSNSGKYRFRWVFHASHAEIRVEKADESRKYWFLYEGPVAGSFSPGNQYWGNDIDGLRTDVPSIYQNPQSGSWQWAYFGQRNMNRTLFVSQAERDTVPDYFAYMGNDPAKENLSADGMNVFGFGRDLKTNPLLSGKNRFVIGLFPLPLNQTENLPVFVHSIKELWE